VNRKLVFHRNRKLSLLSRSISLPQNTSLHVVFSYNSYFEFCHSTRTHSLFPDWYYNCQRNGYMVFWNLSMLKSNCVSWRCFFSLRRWRTQLRLNSGKVHLSCFCAEKLGTLMKNHK
jgi:hypothetical protein